MTAVPTVLYRTNAMAAAAPTLFQGAAETSIGCVRALNEDAASFHEDLGLFIVCDGMGRQREGAVASRLALQTVLDHVSDVDPHRLDLPVARARLLEAVDVANAAVYAAGHTLRPNLPLQPMRTTFVALWLVQDRALVVHLGDSRCYRLRDRVLQQVTRDHTVAKDPALVAQLDLVAPGFVERYTHLLTRSMGQAHACVPDVWSEAVDADDRYLLCSDGLTAVLADEEIADILLDAPSPDAAASALVLTADERGGPDNTTVLVAWPRLMM